MIPLAKLPARDLPAAIAAEARTLELFMALGEIVGYGRVEFEWVHGELRFVRLHLQEMVEFPQPPHP